MPVDSAIPITRDEELPTADQDIDPDALDDEDAQQEQARRPADWNEPRPPESENRPEDWNEPPAGASVPSADEPSPMSDDQR